LTDEPDIDELWEPGIWPDLQFLWTQIESSVNTLSSILPIQTEYENIFKDSDITLRSARDWRSTWMKHDQRAKDQKKIYPKETPFLRISLPGNADSQWVTDPLRYLRGCV
jgi:hypothetical protein